MASNVAIDPSMIMSAADAMNYANNAANAIFGGGAQANQALQQWGQYGLTALNNTYDQAYRQMGQNYGQAQGALSPYMQYGQQGSQAYMNSLGMNPGSGGGMGSGLSAYYNSPNFLNTNNPVTPGQSLTQQFQSSPGYQWQLNQALQAAEAQMARAGLGQSGALGNELATTASGLADQEYNNWLTNRQNNFNTYQGQLSGLNTMGAQASQNSANLYGQQAVNQAGVSTGLGDAASKMYGSIGQGISNNTYNSALQASQLQSNMAQSAMGTSYGMISSIVGAAIAAQNAGPGARNQTSGGGVANGTSGGMGGGG